MGILIRRMMMNKITFKKFFALAILTTVLLGTVCNAISCSDHVEGALQVSSMVSNEHVLSPAEPSIDKMINSMSKFEYLYYHLEAEGGELRIKPGENSPASCTIEMDYGYFTGTDVGEFGGYCRYNAYGDREGE